MEIVRETIWRRAQRIMTTLRINRTRIHDRQTPRLLNVTQNDNVLATHGFSFHITF